MTKIFKAGQLVIYDDILYGESLCVVLTDGVSGYGNDTRVIYIVYSFQHCDTCLAYGSEVTEMPKIQVT